MKNLKLTLQIILVIVFFFSFQPEANAFSKLSKNSIYYAPTLKQIKKKAVPKHYLNLTFLKKYPSKAKFLEIVLLDKGLISYSLNNREKYKETLRVAKEANIIPQNFKNSTRVTLLEALEIVFKVNEINIDLSKTVKRFHKQKFLKEAYNLGALNYFYKFKLNQEITYKHLFLILENIKSLTKKAHFRGGISYYHSSLHGHITANGELYNENTLTAAHKSLPFGTIVRVVNPISEKFVDVRINDRGPFIPKRVIDLSKKSFLKIAPISRGVVKGYFVIK